MGGVPVRRFHLVGQVGVIGGQVCAIGAQCGCIAVREGRNGSFCARVRGRGGVFIDQ